MTHRISIALALLWLQIPAGLIGAPLGSSKECRTCHNDIFKLWNASLHGRSYTDPSFQASYLTLMLSRGKEAGLHCLRCHAPLASGDVGLSFDSPAASEGVSCSFCHAIAAVRGGHIDTCYVLDTSGIVHGPYDAVAAAGHPTRHSAVHERAELCAGCHEFTNENGIRVLETYSEWSASSYPANQVHCQNCHMPIMYDLAVADNRDNTGHYVTAHEFRGGHSRINLAHAVDLQTEAVQKGATLQVTVKITNAESGHKLPTGVPVRRLVLNVALKTSYNSVVSSARKIYRKVLTDKYGTVLETVPAMFLEAAGVFSDNRIGPKETRVETFSFDLPTWLHSYVVDATLTYEYNRQLLTEELVSIEMAKKSLPGERAK